MINEIGSKKYQANKLDKNFGTEGVLIKLFHRPRERLRHSHIPKFPQYIVG
jgi:hypothetical protein